MNTPEKNIAAVALGRRGKGKPKTLSDQERARRVQAMRDYHDRLRREKAERAGSPKINP